MHNFFKAIVICLMLLINLCSSGVFAGESSGENVIVQNNTAFACDLYQKLSVSEGNIFISPYSISTALAMTYAGSRGNTKKEMSETLRFSLDKEDLYSAFAGIESRLNTIQGAGKVKLGVANSLWPAQQYRFRDEYLALIKKHYGVSITPVDYVGAPEAVRKKINSWVEQKTQDKIKNLIPTGILNALTRLVLVNAIYFKGNWESQFNVSMTKDAPFYVSYNNTVQTPTMTQVKEFRYAEIDTIQVLELPYVGNELSMIVLLPHKNDGLKQIEGTLNVESLKHWNNALRKREVEVFLPRFKMTSMFRLDNTLKSMGMPDAFNEKKADFSGMDGQANWLYIGAVLHKAFVDVNEEGTEAAAATAIAMNEKGMSECPPNFRADHPFVFLIRENSTGSILFMGRVTDPTKAEE